MTSAIKPLGQVQLGTGLTTVYTAPTTPPNMKTRVTNIWICNTDTAERRVTLRYGSGTLTAANSLFDATPIEANNVYNIVGESLGMVLSAGESIQGLADVAAKITVSIFGEEVT